MDLELLNIPLKIYASLNIFWTYLLLLTRFTGLFLSLPGIGSGERGLVVRMSAIQVLAFVCVDPEHYAVMPEDWAILVLSLGAEFLFGLAIGMIPNFILAGLQTGGMLASTSMGIGAGNLMDPTLGAPTSDLSRIYSDIATVLFLLLGGHLAVIYAVAGLGGRITPGSFFMSDLSVGFLLDRSAEIFSIGVMVSAPVVVALLLTQFVMGLVTKAVPTVNVFVVSFPITITIGLVLSMLALPEVIEVVNREFTRLNSILATFTEGLIKPEAP